MFDQGQLGSCTANAVAGAVEYDAKLNGSDPGFLSRLWIYYYERRLEGSPADQDTGAQGRDGFKVCQKLGVPLEQDWPYDIAKFSDEPPASLDGEATAAPHLQLPGGSPQPRLDEGGAVEPADDRVRLHRL